MDDELSGLSSCDEPDAASSSEDDGIDVESDAGGDQPDTPRIDYKVLKSEQLVTEMGNITADVAAVLGYPPTMCRVLLQHFKWNKENLLEKFYEASDMAAFLKAARVVAPGDSSVNRPKKAKRSNSTTRGECLVCCTDGRLDLLGCGHAFCSSCLNEYLTSKITTEGASHVECLASDCHILVDDEKADKLIKNKRVRAQFHRLISQSFVESNRLMVWCPAPNCERAIKVPSNEPREVKCDCGMDFCFACSMDWHAPVSCRLLKIWLQKCMDDSETANWIVANTKDCPKCKVAIEKNGGCNHMTCTNKSCKHEFCWICFGDWQGHGSHSCNRYNDGGKTKNAADARVALERYLHYFIRYDNHQKSLKLEKKLTETVREKMELIQAMQSMSWVEVQYLQKAVDVLRQCRRTLMYTYAFAFFLERNSHAIMFEDNQERATEQLSGLLERDLESVENHELVTLKQNIQDKYRYVDRRREVLLKHCAEGEEAGLWKFTL